MLKSRIAVLSLGAASLLASAGIASAQTVSPAQTSCNATPFTLTFRNVGGQMLPFFELKLDTWCLWSNLFQGGFPGGSSSSRSSTSSRSSNTSSSLSSSVGSSLSSSSKSSTGSSVSSSSKSSTGSSVSSSSSKSSTSSSLSSSSFSSSSASSVSSSSVSSASSSVSQTGTTVNISNSRFVPANLTIKKGAKVTWKNNDSTFHTVIRNTATGPFSPPIAPGAMYAFTFNATGSYAYHSSLYPNMTGAVLVTP